MTPERFRYRYQYMKSDGELIFRYDNVPHHPEIETFPDHKHEGGRVIASHVPDLRQVVEEITNFIIK